MFHIGSLVIGVPIHPGNYVFKVTGRTRNGWLNCVRHSDQEGKLHPPELFGAAVFKFRTTDVGEWYPRF